jgi:hypothetical protein
VLPRPFRVAAIMCGLACVLASPAAAADGVITPFVATTFAPDTNIVNLEPGAGSKKLTIGVSGGILTNGILGAEGSTSYTFGFFTGEAPLTTVHSGLGTLMGDVLVAVPRSITHESLRPYFAAGMGLMHVSVEDIRGLESDFGVHRNFVTMDIGGGAIGFVNRRAGFRFDVRRFNSLTHETPIRPLFGGSQLSFWRLSVGVIVRY